MAEMEFNRKQSGLCIERRSGESFVLRKCGFRFQLTLLQAEPGHVSLLFTLPMIGSVGLDVLLRGADRVRFRILCAKEVLVLRSELEQQADTRRTA